MSKKRAKKIKLLLLDVDGVMTDGTLWFVPAAPVSKSSSLRDAQNAKADAGGYGIASYHFA